MLFIVAIANPSKAVDLIRDNAADPADEVRDLGRVSAALLTALKLLPGEFMRVEVTTTETAR